MGPRQSRKKGRRHRGADEKKMRLEGFACFFSPQYLVIGRNIAKFLSVEDLVAFMRVSDKFESFVSENAGVRNMFVKKAQLLSAKDLVELMRSNVQFESFVLENAGVCKMFVGKARVECAGEIIISSKYDFPLNYILDDMANEVDEDKRKMKVSAMIFKMHVQFWNRPMKRAHGHDPNDLTMFDPRISKTTTTNDFTKNFKRLLRLCTDSEFAGILFFLEKRLHLDAFPDSVSLFWYDMIRILFKHLENISHVFKPLGQTALHFLARHTNYLFRTDLEYHRRHVNIIRTLCRNMTNEHVALQNTNGHTPLHMVVIPYSDDGIAEVVRILCRNMTKEQIALTNIFGQTPLQLLNFGYSYNSAKSEVTRILCRNMTQEQIGQGDLRGARSPLHIASSYLNAACVRMLCRYMTQEQIGSKDILGQTALHVAVKRKRRPPEAIGRMHIAAGRENAEIVNILCQNMTTEQIGHRDDCGMSPLDLACSEHYVECIRILCQGMSREQIGSKNKFGHTALDIARYEMSYFEDDRQDGYVFFPQRTKKRFYEKEKEIVEILSQYKVGGKWRGV